MSARTSDHREAVEALVETEVDRISTILDRGANVGIVLEQARAVANEPFDDFLAGLDRIRRAVETAPAADEL